MLSRNLWDSGKRIGMWLLSGLTILSGYGLAKLELFGDATVLPLTAVDRAIPLVPWTIWIYGSGTFTCLLAWLSVPDRMAGRRLYFTLLAASLGCWFFFLFFPTTFPRELWPLPAGDSWTLMEFADLRETDSPSNCFPSQHVALAWALGLCWSDWTQRRWWRPVPLVWAALVSVCTLTTKQHYLVDVPGGFVMGFGAWALVRSQVQVRTREVGLTVVRERDRLVIAGLLERARARAWTLDELSWPTNPTTLPEDLARFLSRTVWIEEIARLNFVLLARASSDPALKALYEQFADEESRHADALRGVLAVHGHALEPPGLGASLVLDQFDTLDPGDLDDVALVLVSTPVFETFLDAGTIPFLSSRPEFDAPWFADLVTRIDADEGGHLATNWLMGRQIAREHGPLRSLGMLLNLNILRGAVAVPWMSLEIYSLAHALGFQFRTLLPAFGRLWRIHGRHRELAWFPLWQLFRVFVAAGAFATVVTEGLARNGVLFIRVWTTVGRVTDRLARHLFGSALLRRRGFTEG